MLAIFSSYFCITTLYYLVFYLLGYILKIDVYVFRGGPSCQGISEFNRFRFCDEQLKYDKNRRPPSAAEICFDGKNVVDLLEFAKGHLGRYAFRRLVTLGTLVTVVCFKFIVSISFYFKLICEMNDLVYFVMSVV